MWRRGGGGEVYIHPSLLQPPPSPGGGGIVKYKRGGWGVGVYKCFKNQKNEDIYSILAKTIISIYSYILITEKE